MTKQDRQTLITIANNLADYRKVLSDKTPFALADMPETVASLLELDIESLNRILWPEDYTQDAAA